MFPCQRDAPPVQPTKSTAAINNTGVYTEGFRNQNTEQPSATGILSNLIHYEPYRRFQIASREP
jgi:hypothetical protein